MTAVLPGDLQELLERIRRGESAARERLFPLLYSELRALAASMFSDRELQHSLQPTALVHEVWLRLSRGADDRPLDREHFMALAARVMRQVLVDHARGRQAEKRGAGWERITLAAPLATQGPDAIDLLALDEALERLHATDAFKARIVELRFFAGLTGDEVATVLDSSPSTVDREWRFARAWLAHELRDGDRR